jgi:glutathionylspermidine amidase/synthetase
MIPDPLILYKKNPKKIYSSYGIPFECVELIRRYFILYYGLTFPSIPDAFDMFSSINSLIHINTNQVILLETVNSQNVDDLRVGDIIFWKRNRTNSNYGHVAIVVHSTKGKVVIAQQNREKLVEEYNESDIIRTMNRKNSQFIGIKRLPRFIPIPVRILIEKK